MARTVFCECAIIFLCYSQVFGQKIDNELTKLSPENNGKSTTIFDYHTRMSAYKDLIGSGCYIEFIKTGESSISQRLREFPTKKLPKELYISDEKLSKRKIWDLAGPRIYEFCKGFPTYLIQEVKNRDPSDVDNNDIIKTNLRRRRSTRHYFVGRLRSQTQSQYLNFGNNGKNTGKAEAESNSEGTKAIVVGYNGMGQAQSQSIPYDCEDCYYGKNEYLDRSRTTGKHITPQHDDHFPGSYPVAPETKHITKPSGINDDFPGKKIPPTIFSGQTPSRNIYPHIGVGQTQPFVGNTDMGSPREYPQTGVDFPGERSPTNVIGQKPSQNIPPNVDSLQSTGVYPGRPVHIPTQTPFDQGYSAGEPVKYPQSHPQQPSRTGTIHPSHYYPGSQYEPKYPSYPYLSTGYSDHVKNKNPQQSETDINMGNSGKFSGHFSGVFDLNGHRIHQPQYEPTGEDIHPRPSHGGHTPDPFQHGRFPEQGSYQPELHQKPGNSPEQGSYQGVHQEPENVPDYPTTDERNQTPASPNILDRNGIRTSQNRTNPPGIITNYPIGSHDEDQGGIQKIDEDEDSQAQASVQQLNNETQASAQAQGKFQGRTSQSQVSGSYSGSGSFSGSAGINDGNQGTLTQVSGGKQGSSSSATGFGGKGKSQAQIQLSPDTGKITSFAQSGGRFYQTQTQVQGGDQGGMANAQSSGSGQTSSQAQIGFSPYNKNEETNNIFLGGGMANAQGGSRFGQSQTQIHGKFQYGIQYTGGAQAFSGSKRNFPKFKPLTRENTRMISQERNEQVQHNSIPNNYNAKVVQTDYDDSERTVRSGETFQSGQLVPGTKGYRIPPGFRGKIKSIASPSQTYTFGRNSQAQTVSLTPGTGEITYETPYNMKSETSCETSTNSCIFRRAQRICLPNVNKNPDGTITVC